MNQNSIKLTGPPFIFRKYRGIEEEDNDTTRKQKTNPDFWIFYRKSESFYNKSMT